MRTVDHVRHDIEVANRFLYELEEAVGALLRLGYADSIDPGGIQVWDRTLSRRDEVRESVFRLESELFTYSNR